MLRVRFFASALENNCGRVLLTALRVIWGRRPISVLCNPWRRPAREQRRWLFFSNIGDNGGQVGGAILFERGNQTSAESVRYWRAARDAPWKYEVLKVLSHLKVNLPRPGRGLDNPASQGNGTRRQIAPPCGIWSSAVPDSTGTTA